ncbi:MAG: endonuclease/exonuclease/phosphatase family protein, partial [Cyclobacteriaceae bacterium]|nr:endonuclease/exonuclease/phosphatase family protein [Cyclobacteriaceae bacterium]
MPLLNFVCWNVNGIRSIVKKDFLKDIKAMNPDMICLQETKASVDEVNSALKLLPGFKVYANDSKARKGYSGTAILSKE